MKLLTPFWLDYMSTTLYNQRSLWGYHLTMKTRIKEKNNYTETYKTTYTSKNKITKRVVGGLGLVSNK
jgi:hypothetical protein